MNANRELELITPHGDLKHYIDVPTPIFKKLITPHGDLKPLPVCAQPPAITSTHYPSWGFETPEPSRGGERGGQLITPHGDLKP